MPAGLAILPPDTVLVHDPGLSRFTWYLRDGTVARTEADPLGSTGYIGFELLGVDAAGGILGIRDEFRPVDLEVGERHRPLRVIVRLEGVPLRETPLIELPGAERELREMIPGQFASAPAPGGADTRVAVAGPCTLVAFETEVQTLAAFDLSGTLGPAAQCHLEAGVRITAVSLPRDPLDGEVHRVLLIDPRTPHVTAVLTASADVRWLTAGDEGAIIVHVDDLGIPTPHLILSEDVTP